MVPGGSAERKLAPKMSIMSLVAGVVLIAVVGLGVLVFFYKTKLIESNEQKKQQIKSTISSIDPTLTERLTLVKARIDAAEELFVGHIALSSLFDLIEQNTISTIQLDSLDYAATNDKGYEITATGVASGYNDIAYQSDILSKNQNFKDLVISNFAVTETGGVTFSLSATIDSAYLGYKKALERLSTDTTFSEETLLTPNEQ